VEKPRKEKQVRAFYPLMIVPGMVLLLAPSTVETIMESYRFREALGGLLVVVYFAGGVVGILLITRIMQRLSVKQLTLSQVVILSASLAACSVSPWYPLLLFFFLIAGFANGILITFPGVFVTYTCRESTHHKQSVLYGFFSMGVVAGPLIAGLIIDRGISWRWVFVTPAVLIIPLCLPVAIGTFERIDGVQKLSVGVLRRIAGFNRALFTGLFVALLFYIAAESAVSMWIVTFLSEERGVSIAISHWVLTGLWAALTLGRWVCGYFSTRFDPYLLLMVLAGSAGIFIIAAPVSGTPGAAIVLYPMVGLFYSGIYPLLVGYASWFPEELASSVFTLFVAAGAAGSTFLPYFVGLVNQFAGSVIGMCSIALPVFGVMICVFLIRNHISRGRRVSGSPLPGA
jgi:MFS transporter, FHS family, glucose/mannose:H+ symporter